MRYLGVDPGGKRVGLAAGDDATGVASPLAVIEYRGARATADALRVEAERIAAEAVVIGLPTGADGRETASCRRSRALATALGEKGVAVILQPERLTTREARERARACGRAPGAPVDDLAALVILEEFLAGRRAALNPPLCSS